jgi:hypothetical protein
MSCIEKGTGDMRVEKIVTALNLRGLTENTKAKFFK